MKAYDLNPEKIGRRLLGLVPAAKQGDHSYPKSTAKDYLDHSDPETEFISDILNLPTQVLVDKWYGGDEAILNLLHSALEKMDKSLKDK
ncbi:hypothetical protein [Peribacillus frigoritolerans]|uniref:hypothetical protein n=1 Tax=Peribacillus frigoritolerans TaxID=450367 RepID=UPI003D266AE1